MSKEALVNFNTSIPHMSFELLKDTMLHATKVNNVRHQFHSIFYPRCGKSGHVKMH